MTGVFPDIVDINNNNNNKEDMGYVYVGVSNIRDSCVNVRSRNDDGKKNDYSRNRKVMGSNFKNVVNRNDKINILEWNIAGAKSEAKLASLKEEVRRYSIDVVCVIESKMKMKRDEDRFESMFKDEFTCFFFNRKNMKKGDKGSGGMVLMIRNELRDVCKVMFSNEFVVCVVLELLDAKKLFLMCLYLPPVGSMYVSGDGDVDVFVDDLNTFLLTSCGVDNYVCCVGDFNARVGALRSVVNTNGDEMIYERKSDDIKTDDRGRRIMNVFSSVNYILLNGMKEGSSFFTFDSHQGKSVIDLCFVNDILFDCCTLAIHESESQISDHNLLVIEINMKLSNGCLLVNNLKKDKIVQLSNNMWGKGDKSLWVSLSSEIGVFFVDLLRIGYTYTSQQVWNLMSACFYDVRFLLKKSIRGRREGKEVDLEAVSNIELRMKRIRYMLKKKLKKCRDTDERKELYIELNINKKRLGSLFRSRVRRKKMNQMKKIEELKISDNKKYWKSLKDVSGWCLKNDEISVEMGIKRGDCILMNEVDVLNEWKKAFEVLAFNVDKDDDDKLMCERKARLLNEVSVYNDGFDFDEIESVCKKLVNDKAPGVDGVLNEFLKYADDNVIKFLCILFNKCWEEEKIPTEWKNGIVSLIYKDGDRLVPFNYRGISLLSNVFKLYSVLILKRLNSFCVYNNILFDEQGGFRSKRGCEEQVFTLVELLRMRKFKKKKTFVCFIDIEKAYDSVWREGLWKRLDEYGVDVKIRRILWDFYEGVKSKVRVGDRMSDEFSLFVGVRQGCVLSPLLFSLFINELIKRLKDAGFGLKFVLKVSCGDVWFDVDNVSVECLFFADDIVLMAENVDDLQKMLKIVFEFCEEWKLRVNIKKTKVMVFSVNSREGESDRKCDVWYNSVKLDVVRMYKYLGVDICDDLKWKLMKNRLCGKAERNVNRALAMGISSGTLSVVGARGVWETIGRSCVEYCVSVWCEGRWNEVEVLQYSVGRKILRGSKSMSKEFVLGEMGWWNLKARRDLLRLLFWWKICYLSDVRLTKKVYLLSKYLCDVKKVRNWCYVTKNLLVELSLDRFWENGLLPSLDMWRSMITVCIHENEVLKWKERMMKVKKLRYYFVIKRDLIFEKRIYDDSFIGRILWTKLRGGVLNLRVEEGRRLGEEYWERKCVLCEKLFGLSFVEDEMHVLFWCGVYDDLRDRFVEKLEERFNFKFRVGGLWVFDIVDLFCFILKGGGEILEDRVRYQIEDGVFLSRLIKKFLINVMKRRKVRMNLL